MSRESVERGKCNKLSVRVMLVLVLVLIYTKVNATCVVDLSNGISLQKETHSDVGTSLSGLKRKRASKTASQGRFGPTHDTLLPVQ